MVQQEMCVVAEKGLVKTAEDILRDYRQILNICDNWDNLDQMGELEKAFAGTPHGLTCVDERAMYDVDEIFIHVAGLGCISPSDIEKVWEKIHQRYPGLNTIFPHEDCGAKGLYLKRMSLRGLMRQSAEDNFKKSIVAKSAHLAGEDSRIEFASFDSTQYPMSGNSGYHPSQSVFVTMQDFNPKRLGLPMTMMESAWCHPRQSFSQKEFRLVLDIMLGKYGIGRQVLEEIEKPLVVVFVGRHEEADADFNYLEQTFGPVLDQKEYQPITEVYHCKAPFISN